MFAHSSNFIVLVFFCCCCFCKMWVFIWSCSLHTCSYYSGNLPLCLNHSLNLFFCQCVGVSFRVRFYRVAHQVETVFLLTLFWNIFCHFSHVQPHFKLLGRFLGSPLSFTFVHPTVFVCLLLFFLKNAFCMQIDRSYL